MEKRRHETQNVDKLYLKKKLKTANEKLEKKNTEIAKILGEKEEFSRLCKVAQDREKLLVERLGEEKYLKSLLDGLNTTSNMLNKSDISMNQSVVQKELEPLRNVQAVPDADQQHVTLIFTNEGFGGKVR